MVNRKLTGLGTALVIALSLPAQRTWQVDPDGGGDFLTVQAAVDAASPGDVIRVAYGRYPSVVIDKGVRILAEPWRDERVLIDSIQVTEVPRDQVLMIADLQTLHLQASDCAGDIYLGYLLGSIEMRRCASVTAFRNSFTDTLTAVRLEDSRFLAIDSRISGGGNTGISALRSQVTIVGGRVTGGSFGRSGTPAGILIDTELVYSRTTSISPGRGLFGDPARVVHLSGTSQVFRAPHSLSIETDDVQEQLHVSLASGYVQPHVLLAGSLPGRPVDLPEGDFHLDQASLQLLFAGTSHVDQDRELSIDLSQPLMAAIHRRDFSNRNPPAGAQLLGVAFTFQALISDQNGERLLSLPYTIIF